jgi:tyrosine decarboxylase/aspartate 1-decarboxylase
VAMKPDQESVLCLRSVLMKPEHRAWMDRLWQALTQAADEAERGHS